MLKHMDFILEENKERKTKLRFYPKKSSLHLFDSGLGKEPSERTFEDVYKIYYCWSILQSDNDYDIDINESGNIKKISDDWSSFKQIFGFWCDECSALSGIGDLTRHVIHTHENVDNYITFGQPGSDWNVHYHNDEKQPWIEYMVWNNISNKGFRFCLDVDKAYEFADFIDGVNRYMLEHGVPI